VRVLQLSLLLAAAGALVILLRLFGETASFAGLVAMIAGTVLSAPYAPPPEQPGRGWWTLLAVGTAITLVAAGLSLLTETAGGLLAVVGCVLVAIAVALGFPAKEKAS
jgi:hypothetical protein